MSNFYVNIARVGNNILVREYDSELDKVISYKDEFRPTLYIPTNEKSGMKTLDGRYLDKIEPGNMKECRDFLDTYKHIDTFEVFGNTDYIIQYIAKNYSNMDYDLSKIRIANIDIEVGSDQGFPNADDANFPITSITVYDNVEDKYHIFGYDTGSGHWQLSKTEHDFITADNSEYYACKSEVDLIQVFLKYWQKAGFAAITGWNIEGFDIPYMVNRISKIIGPKSAKRLSPWGFVREKTIRGNFGQEFISYEIMGITVLDYLQLYKKYTYKAQDAYSLDHIAYVELGERKMSYEEEGSLHQLYKTNYHKYVDYNIKDVHLVRKLDEKMDLMNVVFTVAYYAQINYSNTFSPVKTWDSIIFNYLQSNNIGMPPSMNHEKGESFAGAYVKDPLIKLVDWLMSFDLNSLYPHLIMQYNLGPETIIDFDDLPDELKQIKFDVKVVNDKRFVNDGLVDKEIDLSALKKHNISMSANNQFFDNTKQSFFSVMMESLYKDRKANKYKMLEYEQEFVNVTDPTRKLELKNLIAKYNNLQMAQKILLNSAYGAIGNPYFRFFDLRIAEAITISGQLSIKWIADRINVYLNKLLNTEEVDYVIAIDTDSNYVAFGDLVKKIFGTMKNVSDERIVDFLDTVSKEKLTPMIDESYEELASYMNAYQNKMVMGREVIASRGMWTAKKRYMLDVWDSEGVRYNEPKMKVMGLESKKSNTPEICREKLKEAYQIILRGTEDDLQKFIAEFKKEWYTLPADAIATPSSANGIKKYADQKTIFSKGCPGHIRGALAYNSYIKEHGFDKRGAPEILIGEKIKWLELKMPNPLFHKSVGFPKYLPEMLGLQEYIDYDLMFEKTFLKPLRTVLDVPEWSDEKRASLKGLF